MKSITIRRPDDFHVHLRDETPENYELLKYVIGATASQFARAVTMTNVRPPVRSGKRASEYHAMIRRHVAELGYSGFEPIVPIMLCDGTTPHEIREARSEWGVRVAKALPSKTTTNSEIGVTDLLALKDVLWVMQEVGMVLSVHPQMPGGCIWTAEQEFMLIIEKIASRYPRLRIVAEHISTADSVVCISHMPDTVAATITPQHLWLTISDLVGNAIKPHNICNPPAKLPSDREMLRWAAMSRHPKFFLGTDSAPHPSVYKECNIGRVGVFSAPVALPLLAQLFDRCEKLDRLEAFVSVFGAQHYGLPLNEGTITLVEKPFRVPTHYPCAQNDRIIPLLAGEALEWSIA